VLLWAGVLFYASSRSDTGGLGRIPDWATHGTAYLILGWLVARALAGGFPRPLSRGAALATVVIATLYGVTDEYHQAFVPGRDSSGGDVAKDSAGALVAAVVYRRLTSRRAGGQP
jgi:VanZ family protein